MVRHRAFPLNALLLTLDSTIQLQERILQISLGLQEFDYGAEKLFVILSE